MPTLPRRPIIEYMFEPTPSSPATGRLQAALEARVSADVEVAKAIHEVAAELDEDSPRQVLASDRGLAGRIAPERLAEPAGEAPADRFVRKLPTDDPATARLSARVATADAIFFDAMVDRFAGILSDHGDTDPWDALRAKAVGVLARPALAQQMLAEAASEAPWPGDLEPL